ncbi:MAG: hypothetical protein WDO71_03355 [Bacteroidota bacterium]
MAVFDYYDGVADFHQFDYYSYKKGLVDEWAVWYGGVYKMEYDHNGRLKKARNYDGDVLLYTIHFFIKMIRWLKRYGIAAIQKRWRILFIIPITGRAR